MTRNSNASHTSGPDAIAAEGHSSVVKSAAESAAHENAVYDLVADGSEGSFPASDPPSYMGKLQAGSPGR